MFKNFQLAGTLLGALFSKNPNISDEDKQALATALDTDVDGLKAEHNAAQVAEIDRLKGELGTAQSALTAKETALQEAQQELQDVKADLQPKADKLATLEPEYNTLKAQVDAYKGKVHGKKPNEAPVGAAKTLAEERAEAKEAAEDLDRLKAEHPYTMAGV